jgi:rhodanese-related sulfurtransferase
MSVKPYAGVEPQEAADLLGGSGATLLDVRSPQEFAGGAAPGAINVPIKLINLEGEMVDNPDFAAAAVAALEGKSGWVVTTCYAGRRGAAAANALAATGHDSINLLGGLRAWEGLGLPVVDADGAACKAVDPSMLSAGH